ncbi:uncharacterized protein N7496_011956 [Penicillium cataractarum]|uniref:CENP-V/GFA domain-containing protein n=1 Tax=Penicillium cataractarum TaxID=2100454 RepID=A0A9W9UVZ2_9EURO|nr:uncharacterized protein N7496_011956 [Penicillium cataractarum]KAJ5359543.1 hypothetical protein N7496_011956 [Penicillium cataractarum]
MAPSYLTGACLCKKNSIPHYSAHSRAVAQGSGFSANIVVAQSSFEYTKGSPKLYLDGSNKGGVVYREFCADCGTPFTSRSDDDEEEVAVKSGTLDDEDRERCGELGMEIYCRRKDGWVDGIGGEGVKKLNQSMDG